MTQKKQIYRCNVCGNIVEVLNPGQGQLVCCGQPMELLEENTTDASLEKHVPVIEKTDLGFKVKVGSIPHPMEERVIDGDTIEIEGGKKVRYLGIDTPETVDPRKPVQCFGIEASNANKKLVLGKRVKLEKDISETDKYGRLLRYVYVDDIFVNDYLVRNGYAYAVTFPPDVKYQQQFLEAQKEARENKRGLWSACQSKNN